MSKQQTAKRMKYILRAFGFVAGFALIAYGTLLFISLALYFDYWAKATIATILMSVCTGLTFVVVAFRSHP